MIGSRDRYPTGWRWPKPFIPSPDQPMEEKAI